MFEIKKTIAIYYLILRLKKRSKMTNFYVTPKVQLEEVQSFGQLHGAYYW